MQQGAGQARRSMRAPFRVNDQGAGEILPNNTPRSLGNGEGLSQASQIVAEQNDVGTFLRHVGAGSHGDPDIGFCKRRCIIYAVADLDGSREDVGAGRFSLPAWIRR